MIAFDPFTASLVERLGWTLLHSLWQGAAVAVVLALLLLVIPSARPNMRYGASCVSLLAILALSVATFCVVVTSAPSIAVETMVDDPFPEPMAIDEPADMMSPATEIPALPIDPAPAEVEALPDAAATPAPAEPWQDRLAAFAQRLLPWLAMLWMLGVGALSIWHVGGWIALCRLRKIGTSPVPGHLNDLAARLQQRLRISRPVRILQSTVVQIPAVLGHLRPVILLPVTTLTGLSPEQIEAILAHELAHIRRADYLVSLLQTVAETLLFHHPAVWWISRRIRAEREFCCDDLALTLTTSRKTYAQALASLAGVQTLTPRPAIAADGANLLSRLTRILRPSPQTTRRRSHWLTSALLATLCIAGALSIYAATEEYGSSSNAETPEPPAMQPAFGQMSESNHVDSPQIDAPEPPAIVPNEYLKHLAGARDILGPVIERVVNDDGTVKDFLIDLDTGQLFTPPKRDTFKDGQTLLDWVANHGIDATGETKTSVQGLMGFDMIAIPISGDQWNQPQTAFIHEQLSLGRPGTPATMSGKGDLPATFLFKTREGSEGILQITDFPRESKGVKIRYRLLQPTSTATQPSTDVATQTGPELRRRRAYDVGDFVETEVATLLDQAMRATWGPNEAPRVRVSPRNQIIVAARPDQFASVEEWLARNAKVPDAERRSTPEALRLLRPGDRLRIRARDFFQRDVESDLSQVVDEHGQIYLPKIGKIKAEGLTASALRDKIIEVAKAKQIYRADSFPAVFVDLVDRDPVAENHVGSTARAPATPADPPATTQPAGLPKTSMAPGATDPLVRELEASLVALQQHRARLIKQLGPEHRVVRDYDHQIETAEAALKQAKALIRNADTAGKHHHPDTEASPEKRNDSRQDRRDSERG